MGYLKIAFYGLLAFIERHPIFCLIMVALAVFAPFVFKWVGWVLLGILALVLIGIVIAVIRFKRMQRQMEEQMRKAGGGFGGGSPFGGMGGSPFGNTGGGGSGSPFGNMGGATNGMTLEEFVKRMQAEADARQQQGQQKPKRDPNKSDVDSTEYVDFEEVK